MAYATADDVIRRYNPINTMIGTGSMQVSTVDIASVYISDSEAIINAYLSRRYVLPLNAEPLLTDLTADIAVCRILRERAPRFPDFMEKRYTDAMSLLVQIRDGGMDLLSSSGVTISSGGDQFAWSNVIEDGQNGPVFRSIESESDLDCVGVNSADRLSYG